MSKMVWETIEYSSYHENRRIERESEIIPGVMVVPRIVGVIVCPRCRKDVSLKYFETMVCISCYLFMRIVDSKFMEISEGPSIVQNKVKKNNEKN